MAEQVINLETNEGIHEPVNPYFAIEEDIYGEENKKRRMNRRRTWIEILLLSLVLFVMVILLVYDVFANIAREGSLSQGTLVAGMDYETLRENMNKSNDGSGKTLIDFNNPYVAENGDNLSLSLSGKKIVITSPNVENLNYILISPTSQVIYTQDFVFDGNSYDFNTHNLMAGDYLICAFKDPFSIPYRPVVDKHFFDRIGSGSFRRASLQDQSIQMDSNIQLIQDPTLLCLSLIRVI